MKTLALTLTFLAGLPLALAAQVSKEDIKKLTAAGISDEVILSYVKANGPVAKLSAEDVIELKQAGASEKLLSVILGGSQAPATERVVEKTVLTQPATRYVYDSTPYYYTPSYYDYDYYPRSYYYPTYSYYYPRYYSSSYCYPRSSYYYPSFSVGFSTGGRWCGTRGSIGVSGYRR